MNHSKYHILVQPHPLRVVWSLIKPYLVLVLGCMAGRGTELGMQNASIMQDEASFMPRPPKQSPVFLEAQRAQYVLPRVYLKHNQGSLLNLRFIFFIEGAVRSLSG